MATITSITPTYGSFTGGTVLTFVGSGFQTGVTSLVVAFNGIPSTNVVVASDISMTAVVPALPAASEYNILVTTNLGVSNSVAFYAISVAELPSGNILL